MKRAKGIRLDQLVPHPVFVAEDADLEADRLALLEQMKSYRPNNVSHPFLVRTFFFKLFNDCIAKHSFIV